jgi:hypothetical protein
VTETDFYVPIEWTHLPGAQGVAAFRQHLGMYARSLRLWPSLWEFWRARGTSAIATTGSRASARR